MSGLKAFAKKGSCWIILGDNCFTNLSIMDSSIQVCVWSRIFMSLSIYIYILIYVIEEATVNCSFARLGVFWVISIIHFLSWVRVVINRSVRLGFLTDSYCIHVSVNRRMSSSRMHPKYSNFYKLLPQFLCVVLPSQIFKAHTKYFWEHCNLAELATCQDTTNTIQTLHWSFTRFDKFLDQMLWLFYLQIHL